MQKCCPRRNSLTASTPAGGRQDQSDSLHDHPKTLSHFTLFIEILLFIFCVHIVDLEGPRQELQCPKADSAFDKCLHQDLLHILLSLTVHGLCHINKLDSRASYEPRITFCCSSAYSHDKSAYSTSQRPLTARRRRRKCSCSSHNEVVHFTRPFWEGLQIVGTETQISMRCQERPPQQRKD